MKFEEILERTRFRELSQGEAASVPGVSERTFLRWRVRFEAEGAEGLYDRRLGRASARRVPVDTVIEVLELFDTRYFDFTARHFWEKLVSEHAFKRSYNWVRLTLQAYGRTARAPRRGAHRRKRPRRALPGMMLHQDGSSHEWVAGRCWDLIVTMDDATSETLSAFFVAEEGTMSAFRGLSGAISAKGLFCALYADRAGHYWHTPVAGGKVDRDNPTQVGRALIQLGIDLIPAYSPEARGRSERMFGTLQKRLPQELIPPSGRMTSSARWYQYPLSGRQDHPAGGGVCSGGHLRGGLPGLFLRLPAGTGPARCAGRASCRDLQETGELGGGRGYPGLLRCHEPQMDVALSPAPYRGQARPASDTTERMKSFVRSVESAPYGSQQNGRRALWRESQGRGCARPAPEGH